MLKNATPQEKFNLLQDWLGELILPIKRDLKNEHLKKDPRFAKKYMGKPFPKLETADLVAGYKAALQDEQYHLLDYIFQKWLLKNTDIYEFFSEELQKVYDSFDELETLEEPFAQELAKNSCKQFGAKTTYLFTIVNSVVFPEAILNELKCLAEKQNEEEKNQAPAKSTSSSLEDQLKACEKQMQQMINKYEKRLSGLERKYQKDTETLKKQLANLQRKLA